MITIWHNPKCSKSRECLKALEKVDEDIFVRDYLNNPPTLKEISDVLKLLKLKPKDLIRKKEELFKTLKLSTKLDDSKYILAALKKYPKLIERPIIINGKKAVIGRPVEKIKEVL